MSNLYDLTVPEEMARFMNYVEPCASTGCWLWIGGLSGDGYGTFRQKNGKQIGAHRASWKIFKDGRLEQQWVLHHCDVPSCVNPSHLFLGSPKDNSADMLKKGREHRHPHGTRHHNSKLTPDQVMAIRNDSRSHQKIADDYHLSQTTISKIKRDPLYV